MFCIPRRRRDIQNTIYFDEICPTGENKGLYHIGPSPVLFYRVNRVPVKKGLYSLLEYLSKNNYKLAVASSSPRWEVEKHLKDAQVFKYFNIIVCGDMVSRSKPEPEIYLKACELLGEQPEDCYALEDSKNGLLSAYRAGCKPIMVPDLWQPDKEIERILFGKFADLDEVKEFFEK